MPTAAPRALMLGSALCAGGLLNCPCFTVTLQSPTGVIFEMPSMQSLQGMTLLDTQAGKYRQKWQLAPSARSSSSQELTCTHQSEAFFLPEEQLTGVHSLPGIFAV